jgi:bifunctional non-homologous end joining protein LigD
VIRAAEAAETSLVVDGRTLLLHHTDKVFWPDLGLTKADLINYYLEVSPYLLPLLKGRPFIMRPFPDGVGGRSYYRWEIPDYAPPWLHRWLYAAKTEERVIDMLVVEGLPELVWLANQAVIEMHPWLSRTDDPMHPDLIVFDLDPGPEAGFAAALEVAARLHALLDELGLRSHAKTSGKKGMHVLVPVERRYTFQDVRAWVQGVARRLATAHPGEVTTDKALEKRRGKVLIDYSQNGLGKSIASAYSVRASPGATVSTPLTPRELAAGKVRPGDFTMLTVPARLQEVGDLLARLREGQELPEVE